MSSLYYDVPLAVRRRAHSRDARAQVIEETLGNPEF